MLLYCCFDIALYQEWIKHTVYRSLFIDSLLIVEYEEIENFNGNMGFNFNVHLLCLVELFNSQNICAMWYWINYCCLYNQIDGFHQLSEESIHLFDIWLWRCFEYLKWFTRQNGIFHTIIEIHIFSSENFLYLFVLKLYIPRMKIKIGFAAD